MLAENMIDIKQCELMIDWCASVLDTGSLGTVESSMTKVAVSEALMRIADKCVQVMGGLGVTDKTIVETMFREVRAFRIDDGPTEVHKLEPRQEAAARLEGRPVSCLKEPGSKARRVRLAASAWRTGYRQAQERWRRPFAIAARPAGRGPLGSPLRAKLTQ